MAIDNIFARGARIGAADPLPRPGGRMTDERVFNVLAWRRGHNVAMVSRIGRDPAAAERSRMAHQDNGLESLYLIGRWRVRDHSDTIAALCGTAGCIR